MKSIISLFVFVVGLFAGLFVPPAKCTAVKSELTYAMENAALGFQRLLGRAAMQLALAVDRLFGVRTPFALAAVGEDVAEANREILRHLSALGDRMKKVDGLQDEFRLIKEEQNQVKTGLTELQKTMLAYQKHMVEQAGKTGTRTSHDGISNNTARFLGGLYLLASLKQDNEQRIKGETRRLYEEEIKSILGIEAKTAVTTSDIPVPTLYSGDIVELVYEYGIARKVGTVLPLGSASFKLQKLTSSPTFGLIAASGTVTEKVPQAGWVTFNPEKFGGLIRLPSEIEDDSILGIGQFLARYSARQMAQVEDYNFFRSTGAASGQNGTAEGLTTSVVTDSKFYYQGGSSSSSKTKQSDMTLADLRSLRAVPSGAVLGRASYYMHPTYEAALVAFNNNTNGIVYVRGTAGSPATLDGFPIVWVPDMPAYSTSTSASLVHVLFGDASYNYLGIRGAMRYDTSREAGFTTDEVLVRALERFTIGKMATDCVAGLRNSAT